MASHDSQNAGPSPQPHGRIEGHGGVSYERLTPTRLPIHPVPAMQGAFEQSIIESTEDDSRSIDERDTTDPVARRKFLMEGDSLSDQYSSRWQRRPGATWHPLWKLIAQISFGVHLLHNKLAKSDQEVLKIMQTHVDEVDSFVEDTIADFDLAINDIKDRINHLSLPLDHGKTFDHMLRESEFRLAILEGNEVIERIIERTQKAMDFALKDINQGTGATAELAKYLDRLGTIWPDNEKEFTQVFVAMRGNAEGWWRCFNDLQAKNDRLKRLIKYLEEILVEVTRRAGIASRRKQRMSQRPSVSFSDISSAPSSPPRNKSLDKPLPPDPILKALATSVVSHTHKSEDRSAPTTTPSPKLASHSQRLSKSPRHLKSLSVTIEMPEPAPAPASPPKPQLSVPTMTPIISVTPPDTNTAIPQPPVEYKFESPDSVGMQTPRRTSLERASVANSVEARVSNSSLEHENEAEKEDFSPTPDSAYGSLSEILPRTASGSVDLSKANLALLTRQSPAAQFSCFPPQRKSATNFSPSMTALPTFTNPGPGPGPTLEAISVSKKPSQKQSFPGMRGLFGKKRSFKERKIVSGGLGGHTYY